MPFFHHIAALIALPPDNGLNRNMFDGMPALLLAFFVNDPRCQNRETAAAIASNTLDGRDFFHTGFYAILGVGVPEPDPNQ
jgi:hypothetical protein